MGRASIGVQILLGISVYSNSASGNPVQTPISTAKLRESNFELSINLRNSQQTTFALADFFVGKTPGSFNL